MTTPRELVGEVIDAIGVKIRARAEGGKLATLREISTWGAKLSEVYRAMPESATTLHAVARTAESGKAEVAPDRRSFSSPVIREGIDLRPLTLLKMMEGYVALLDVDTDECGKIDPAFRSELLFRIREISTALTPAQPDLRPWVQHKPGCAMSRCEKCGMPEWLPPHGNPTRFGHDFIANSPCTCGLSTALAAPPSARKDQL